MFEGREGILVNFELDVHKMFCDDMIFFLKKKKEEDRKIEKKKSPIKYQSININKLKRCLVNLEASI